MNAMRPSPRPLRLPVAPLLLLMLAALAAFGGCSSATRVVVPNPLPPLSAVVLSPDTDTLLVGGNRQFTAVALDTLGQPVPGAGFQWTSGDPGVFTVNLSGRVTAVGDGSAWLYAQAGGYRDSASVFVYADSGWIVQTSHTNRNLNGVFFLPDGREGWAVGDAGTIMHTTDAGVTWANQVSTTSTNLNGVSFTDPNTGWVVGNLGTVLVTVNRGDTWARVQLGIGENLTDVYFANPDSGCAVGSAGAVLRTVDGGLSWGKQNITGLTLRGVAFADGRRGWAVGDNGEIFGTSDAGLVWTRVQPAITALALHGVSHRTAAYAWAVGPQGAAPQTVDVGGVGFWQYQNIGSLNDLEDVHFPSDVLTGYAVGFNSSGLILKSEDGGQSWTRQVSNTSRRLNDVHFVDRLRGWAVGDAGTIVHTSVGGLR